MLVVDSSFLIALLFEEEHTSFAVTCLRNAGAQRLIAPSLLRWEVANVLRNKAVRGLISPGDAAGRLEGLEGLSIEYPDVEATPAALVDLALRSGLTAYDAAYVELALRTQAELATLDSPMAMVGQTAGLVVHSPFAS